MRKQNNAQKRLFLVALLALSVLVSWGGTAFGQFIVQPMRMDIPLMPKQRFQTALSLQSLDPNEVHSIDLYVVDLTQYENGQYRIIEPNEEFDRTKLSSCRDWIRLSENYVEIQPMGSAGIMVNIQVPTRTRGFYAAGIIASVRPRPEFITQFGVNVRFLTPVFIEVQGRPLPHKVKLKDMGLDHVGSFKDIPAATHVLMSIDNYGGTRSHLKGFAQIKGFLQGHWREITTAEFTSASIIPGAKLQLRANIGRSLPQGQYKVGGWLYVDGRRDQRITREIEFTGDPSVKKVTADAPIDLVPTNLSIRSVPGATRVTAIKVYNASDEAVNVQAAIRLPQSLLGVAFEDLKGEDMDCSEWLEIQPRQFTLRSHSRQAIRIISRMPRNASNMIPCYYALLGLVSTYADGQTGGVTTAPISVTNQNISVEPYVIGMDLRPALKGGNEYYVVARYGNFGRIHFTPVRCLAAIVDGTGSPLSMASLVSRKTDMILPLEARDYSGVIDISRVPEGNYRLATELRYGSSPAERADKQIGIRVMAQGGQKVIEVLQLQEELGGKIEVQW